MEHEKLYFEGRGKMVAIVRVDKEGKKTELVIPTVAVLSLPKIVQEMVHKILAQRGQRPTTQPGTIHKVFFPVERVGLNVEPQTDEILLEMHDTLGNQSGYSLPIEVAKPLAERLPVRIAEAEAASKNRRKQ